MKDLKTIESRVRAILANNEEARDDDMILYLLYCNRYGEVRVGELPFEMVMNNYKVFHIPCFESVRRTRQKIQAATPELGCSPEVRRARRKQQGKYKISFRGNLPGLFIRDKEKKYRLTDVCQWGDIVWINIWFYRRLQKFLAYMNHLLKILMIYLYFFLSFLYNQYH